MGVDLVVCRHRTPGAPHLLSRNLKAGVLNAGDGTHEHPTQGLLDIYTILKATRSDCRFDGGTCRRHSTQSRGTFQHSRTQGTRGAGDRLRTGDIDSQRHVRLGVEVAYNLDDILPEVDCVNLLRVQFERQRGAFFPSIAEYAHLFGMNGERIRKARENLLVLAPGPINRGVELTPEVADGSHSLILNQVTNGLLIRMACLTLLAQERRNNPESNADEFSADFRRTRD